MMSEKRVQNQERHSSESSGSVDEKRQNMERDSVGKDSKILPNLDECDPTRSPERRSTLFGLRRQSSLKLTSLGSLRLTDDKSMVLTINHYDEVLIAVVGMVFFIIYYWTDIYWLHLAMAVMFILVQIFVWQSLLEDVSWLHFIRLIQQMKTVMLFIAVLVIIWTDWHYAFWRKEHFLQSCIGTVGTQSVTLMFILSDISTKVSFFFRAVIPFVLICACIFTICYNIFVLKKCELFSINDHSVGLLQVQNLAWNQVLLVACLGFKDICRCKDRGKFCYLIETHVRKPPGFAIEWKFAWSDFSLMITSFDYVTMYFLEMPFAFQLIPAALFVFISVRYFKRITLQPSYLLRYRPMILIASNCIVLFLEILRLQLDNTISFAEHCQDTLSICFVFFCVVLAILSDFAIRVTIAFRILMPLCLLIAIAYRIYGCTFVYKDYDLIVIGEKSFTLNSAAKMAFSQIFCLLVVFLVFLKFSYGTKYFLLPVRLPRDKILTKYSKDDVADIENGYGADVDTKDSNDDVIGNENVHSSVNDKEL